MFHRSLLAALLSIAQCAFTYASDPEVIAAFTALPDTNPYREILIQVEKLPNGDRQALDNWLNPADNAPAPVLTPTQRAAVTEITAALRAAASSPPATTSDWPLTLNPNDPDNPAANTIAGVGTTRRLAQLATRIAADLPASEAIETYAAVAQLGRQRRAGATLIEQLTGVAIESIAQGAVAARLGSFSVEELRQLNDVWGTLHPAPSIDAAIAGERDVYFRPVVENILVPGLRELLADPDAGQPDTDPNSSDFTSDLRLSALVNLGGGEHRITLENTRTGDSFTLVPGRTVEGIELVSLDFDQHLAVIRRADHEAVIHLASKRIIARKSAATRVREFFAGFDFFANPEEENTRLQQVLALVRAHPDGVEGYARDLLVAYQTGIDQQLALAASPLAPRTSPEPPSDPMLAIAVPSIGAVARSFQSVATQSVMLRAAINHRLGALQGRIDPSAFSDPWQETPTPFVHEPTPDGGFLLRSRYETRPDAPLTYKFAAPDAGVVRPKN